MTAKEFFKRFVWGTFFPAAIFSLMGLLTAAMNSAVRASAAAGYAFEFIAASLSLLMGICAAVYYLLGNTRNVGHMLFGVGCVSVAVYLFVPTFMRQSVIPIAFGVLIILYAAGEAFTAVEARKKGKITLAVRIALSVLFAACGVVACVRPFSAMSSNWIFTGAVMIAQSVCGMAFLVKGGLFREEEQLKFRPVKPSAPAEEKGEEKKKAGENSRNNSRGSSGKSTRRP